MRIGLAILLSHHRRPTPGPDGSGDFVVLQDGLRWSYALSPLRELSTSLSPLRTPRLPGVWKLTAFPLVSASTPPAPPIGLHPGFVCL